MAIYRTTHREEKTKMCYRELTATITELMQVHHTMSRDRESRAELSYNTIHITDNNLIVQHTIIDKPVKRFQ